MANRYWVGGAGNWTSSATANWSTSSGGSGGASAPTSTDNVFFDQAGTYTVTCSGNVPFNLQSQCADFTVSAGTVTFSDASDCISIYGNINFTVTPIFSGATGYISLCATTSVTITTTAGTVFPSIEFKGVGGVYVLQNSITAVFNNTTINWIDGSLNLNGFTYTCTYIRYGFGTRNITFNGGKIVITGSGTSAFNMPSVGGTFTTTAGTGAGIISMTSASAKTFNASGVTIYATLDQAGAGTLTISSSCTLNGISNSYSSIGATTILFPALGNVVDLITSFTATGSAGKVLTLASTSSGNNSNVRLNGGVYSASITVNTIDYLTYQDILFTPTFNGNGTIPYTWHSGANSINLGLANGIVAVGPGYKAYQLNSGTSWTVPADYRPANSVIYLIGGGGGGAGATTSGSTRIAGAGGGGGGFTQVVSAGLSGAVTYAIGAGGTRGSAFTNDATDGGATTFGSYSAAGGGAGKFTSSTSTGGAGGVGATYTGGTGGVGGIIVSTTDGVGAGGGGGAAGPLGNGGNGGAGASGSLSTNIFGGGGGGNGGGSAGGNAVANTSAGNGGNNASGLGGGIAPAGTGELGGGAAGGNSFSGSLTNSGVDVYQTRLANTGGGAGGAGGAGGGSTGQRGSGGSGGSVSTSGGAGNGGNGGAGFIFIIYNLVAGTVNSNILDTVTSTDSFIAGFNLDSSLSETTTATDVISRNYYVVGNINESVTSTDDISTTGTFNPTINETVTSTDDISTTGTFNPVINETATSTDAISTNNNTFNPTISETINSTDLITSQFSINTSISEAVTITDLIEPKYIANTIINETVTITDFLNNGSWYSIINEAATGTDLINSKVDFTSILNETITSTDSFTTAFIGSLFINESVAITDTVPNRGSFNVQFTDYVVAYTGSVANFLWIPIIDDQTPNWQNVGTVQNPTWVDVNDTQAPGWQPINT